VTCPFPQQVKHDRRRLGRFAYEGEKTGSTPVDIDQLGVFSQLTGL